MNTVFLRLVALCACCFVISFAAPCITGEPAAVSPAVGGALDKVLDGDDVEGAVDDLLAAAEDDADAAYYLGVMYANGTGVEQNYAEAANWYAEAAEKGHARAHRNLGSLYEAGEGVRQNFARAIKHYQVATATHPILQWLILRDLGVLYYGGEMFPGFTPAREANEAYKASGLRSMWDFYSRGEKMVQNETELAARVYAKADAGDSLYQFLYSRYLERGQGVGRNHNESTQYLLMAAENNYSPAQYLLATEFRYGQKRNRDQYLLWLRRAAENGSAKAQNDLGETYGPWTNVDEINVVAMHHWMKAAAEGGNPHAMLTMGRLCLLGLEPGGMDAASVFFDGAEATGYKTAAANRQSAIERYGYPALPFAESVEQYRVQKRNTPYDAFILEMIFANGGLGVTPSPARAQEVREQGESRLSAENFDPVRLEKEAEKAPRNYYHLGQMHLHGRGVPMDHAKARDCFRKGEEKKDKAALVMLGYLCRTGAGMPMDQDMARQYYKAGLDWFDKHAERINAFDNIPTINGFWESGKTDRNNAEDWMNLGLAYFLGDGSMPPDFVAGVKCLATAALKGSPGAQISLGALHFGAFGFLNRSDAMAIQWLGKAAESGHVEAQLALGAVLLRGRAYSLEESEKWLTSAAEQDNADAQCLLGQMFVDNYFRPADNAKGELWLTRAANADKEKSATAHFWLGRMHERGKDGRPNLAKALLHFREAFKLDNSLLPSISRRIVYQPPKEDAFHGVEPFADEQTTKQYRELIDAGNVDGLCLLAFMYEAGVGVSQNTKQAYSCFEKAMECGDPDARVYINRLKEGKK